MKIALVDDDAKFLAQTARLVKLFLEDRETLAEVTTFAAAEELSACAFDLYLLDVVLPGASGIELARRIRKVQPEAPILFFTTSRDFAVEAFGIEAVDYVLKPFAQADFVRAMDRSLRRLATVRPSALTLKDADGAVVRVTFRNLVLVEAANHYVVVHVTDGRRLIVRQPLQEIWEQLKECGRFAQIGRQSIVSLAHVTRVVGNDLTLVGGATLTVSRRSLAAFKAAFVRFYGG